MIFIRLILIVFVSSVITTLNAQNNSEKQKQLELQREKLQAEIKQINSLLFQNTAKEKNLILTIYYKFFNLILLYFRKTSLLVQLRISFFFL